MKKLLIVIQHIRRGGPELVAVNYAEFLDKTEYDISFLLINPYEDEDTVFEAELVEKGYKIHKMPENVGGYFKKYLFLKSFFKQNSYDIVHSHVIFFSGLVLRAAKKSGVAVRASHSHIIRWNREENMQYKVYTAVMRMLLKKYSSLKFACSSEAGRFLYGIKEYERNGIFIPNGIDTEKFLFSERNREEIRKEFGVSADELLVGHVGTVYRIKNQSFLVEVFKEVNKRVPESKLILAGQIADGQPVYDKIEELGLKDKIIFTESRNDIQKFYSAYDIMIFPSLFEALPVSLIEAQASKLPCLISDSVTDEVKYNENIEFLSLDESPEIWAEAALKLADKNREDVSNEELIAVYDIHRVVERINGYYTK